MEQQVLGTLSAEDTKPETMQPVDSLVLRTFSENFNKKYSHLLPEQRQLLGKYILAIGDNIVDFQLALKEELQRLYKTVKSSLDLPEVATDETMVENTNKLLAQMSEINVAEITESQLKKVLKMQNLVREYSKDDN
jgi:hypothetical protein